MAITIELANGATFTPTLATSTSVSFHGEHRQGLSFSFDVNDITFPELSAAFTENNCESIKIIDRVEEDIPPTEEVHKGYSMIAEITKTSEQVTPGTYEEAPTYKDVYKVVLVRRTYQENQLRKLQASVDQAMLLALGVD